MQYICRTNLPQNNSHFHLADFHEEKHRQLHIILAIIVSVFSACVVILVAYMVIFPASYSEVESRPRELAANKNKIEEERKVRSLQL